MKLSEKVMTFVDEAIDTADYCTEKNMDFDKASGWIYTALSLIKSFVEEIVAANRKDILDKAVVVFDNAIVKYPKIARSYEYTMQAIKDVLSCN